MYMYISVFDMFWSMGHIGSTMFSVCTIGITSWANNKMIMLLWVMFSWRHCNSVEFQTWESQQWWKHHKTIIGILFLYISCFLLRYFFVIIVMYLCFNTWMYALSNTIFMPYLMDEKISHYHTHTAGYMAILKTTFLNTR